MRKRGPRSGRELFAAAANGEGATGGAPIWTMKAAWMPNPCTCGVDGPATVEPLLCRRHGSRRRFSRILDKREKEGGKWLPTAPYRTALAGGHAKGPAAGAAAQLTADPDGFAVFGIYPKGWLAHVTKLRLLGDVSRDEILHVCSGMLGPNERWTVDVRESARPQVVADGRHLPFRDASFKAVMLDPPYTDAYARNLYGTGNPRPSWLLAEAARVVMPSGRIGMMHVAIPFAPPGCRLVNCWGLTIGVGFRGRFFTVYEKAQGSFTYREDPMKNEKAAPPAKKKGKR